MGLFDGFKGLGLRLGNDPSVNGGRATGLQKFGAALQGIGHVGTAFVNGMDGRRAPSLPSAFRGGATDSQDQTDTGAGSQAGLENLAERYGAAGLSYNQFVSDLEGYGVSREVIDSMNLHPAYLRGQSGGGLNGGFN